MADASVYQAVHPSNGKGFKRTIPGGDSAGSGGAVAGGADGQFVRLEGDEMDGPLSTTELTVEDQAGAGSRAVFANEYGEQQAVAEAVWTPGVYSPIGGTPGWTTPASLADGLRVIGPCEINGVEYACIVRNDGRVSFIAADESVIERGVIPAAASYYFFNGNVNAVSPDGTYIHFVGGYYSTVQYTIHWNGATWDTSTRESVEWDGALGNTFFWRHNTDLGNARYVYLIDRSDGSTLASYDLGEAAGAYGYTTNQRYSKDRSVLVFSQAAAGTVKVVSVARGLEVLPLPPGLTTAGSNDATIISPDGNTVIARLGTGAPSNLYYFVKWTFDGTDWNYEQFPNAVPTGSLPLAMGNTWFSVTVSFGSDYGDHRIYSRESGALLATQSGFGAAGASDSFGRYVIDGAVEFYVTLQYGYGITFKSDPMGVYTPSLLDIDSPVEVDRLTVIEQAGTGVRLVAADADGVQSALANPTSAGSYGSASETLTATIDTQGRVNAMADVSIQIAESQVTNLPADLVRSLRYAWSIA